MPGIKQGITRHSWNNKRNFNRHMLETETGKIILEEKKIMPVNKLKNSKA